MSHTRLSYTRPPKETEYTYTAYQIAIVVMASAATVRNTGSALRTAVELARTSGDAHRAQCADTIHDLTPNAMLPDAMVPEDWDYAYLLSEVAPTWEEDPPRAMGVLISGAREALCALLQSEAPPEVTWVVEMRGAYEPPRLQMVRDGGPVGELNPRAKGALEIGRILANAHREGRT